ncbi:hypothetical protein C943_02427 [Mariniradius saccharolyticus AK6]|uniref:Uncharacterized protein n=1 Tax=Mariniradius saccharolyticus AK6 TaxID=1239962 RepID=M7X190_9BACT|nr:hypothetical protein C943_02427 [Mariniradius saccharolyticus AK6]
MPFAIPKIIPEFSASKMERGISSSTIAIGRLERLGLNYSKKGN